MQGNYIRMRGETFESLNFSQIVYLNISLITIVKLKVWITYLINVVKVSLHALDSYVFSSFYRLSFEDF